MVAAKSTCITGPVEKSPITKMITAKTGAIRDTRSFFSVE